MLLVIYLAIVNPLLLTKVRTLKMWDLIFLFKKYLWLRCIIRRRKSTILVLLTIMLSIESSSIKKDLALEYMQPYFLPLDKRKALRQDRT